MRSLYVDGLALLGAAMVLYGIWQISPRAVWIVAGVMLVFVAIAIRRDRGDR